MWTIVWAAMVFILFSIYAFSQAKAVDLTEGYVAVRILPPGSIIRAEDIKLVKDVAIQKDSEDKLITNPKEVIGKIAELGFSKGEPIILNKIGVRKSKTSELTISTNLGNIPHPVENLKVADIWVDYNPKEYPNMRAQKIIEKVPVSSVRNRKTAPIQESDDKVPVIVVVDTTDDVVAKIKEYSRKGTLFFTNPYPEGVN